jgi:hypothetical protein
MVFSKTDVEPFKTIRKPEILLILLLLLTPLFSLLYAYWFPDYGAPALVWNCLNWGAINKLNIYSIVPNKLQELRYTPVIEI